MEQKNRPVDVISVCSASGQIRPLRLRLEEAQQTVRVDIQEVVSTRQITYVGIEAEIFLCRATVWGREWLFELKYMFRSHMWWILGRVH